MLRTGRTLFAVATFFKLDREMFEVLGNAGLLYMEALRVTSRRPQFLKNLFHEKPPGLLQLLLFCNVAIGVAPHPSTRQ
jgi:hypothetical protein